MIYLVVFALEMAFLFFRKVQRPKVKSMPEGIQATNVRRGKKGVLYKINFIQLYANGDRPLVGQLHKNALYVGRFSFAHKAISKKDFVKSVFLITLCMREEARGVNVYTFCFANVYPYYDPCPTG